MRVLWSLRGASVKLPGQQGCADGRAIQYAEDIKGWIVPGQLQGGKRQGCQQAEPVDAAVRSLPPNKHHMQTIPLGSSLAAGLAGCSACKGLALQLLEAFHVKVSESLLFLCSQTLWVLAPSCRGAFCWLVWGLC